MKNLLRFLTAGLLIGALQSMGLAEVKTPPLDLLHEAWPAWWIDSAQNGADSLSVFHFRKTFSLEKVPEHFVVHVSGDRRYRFFVNGISVGVGPQRSDPFKWRYETYDLAPQLHAGKNVLAATGWNYTDEAPYALISVKTGLIVQGQGEAEQRVNSDSSWKVFSDSSYSEEPLNRAALRTFIVTGPGQKIDGLSFPWGWSGTEFDDASWSSARKNGHGMPDGVGTDVSRWLAPRNIPLMDEQPERFEKVRRSEGATATEDFLAGKAPLTIPAHRDATLLLDRQVETNAFPHLMLSGGRQAVVRLTYAEALIDTHDQKGPRDEVAGRHILGVEDEFVSDGGAAREYSTLLFRTYRYVQVQIHTADEPLTLVDLYGVATGYPLKEIGSFRSEDPSLSKIWEVGWRTARLCAYESYTDCPYYEQLQYIGDTRIQALITLYVSGDDRLMRNAIESFDRSRISVGLTLSRYPATTPQIIPTFSLFWIQMVHDYWKHRRDDAFVADRFLGIQNVLSWFEDRIDAKTGLLGPMPFWDFVDWADQWRWISDSYPGGQPPGAHEGGSAIISLQLAWTLDNAAELFAAYGRTRESDHYKSLANGLRRAVLTQCWDEQRSLIADTPEKKSFSQHANALGVLAHAIEGDRAKELMQKVVDDSALTPCTIYFRFYLLKALKVAGLGDEYLAHLQPWHEMIARGLTTFAEKPDPTRSDCHAWSASPNYDLLATVCGIEPDSPGFASVKIEPHLGNLHDVEGVVAHPAGPIRVSIHHDSKNTRANVDLPPGIAGRFIWKGQTFPLKSGAQQLSLQ